MFDKLNPEALEEQLGRRAQGVAGAELQARLWNRYLELYRATAQSGDAGLPAVFMIAFARAYESLAAGGSPRGPGDRRLIGGEGGIRTHEYLVRYYWNSSPAPSTARPPLRRRGHSLLEPGS